jgi:hypothetical protein
MRRETLQLCHTIPFTMTTEAGKYAHPHCVEQPWKAAKAI